MAILLGLTDSEVVLKLRCCLHKDLSFDFYDWTKEPLNLGIKL